jgi:hypothetical protein
MNLYPHFIESFLSVLKVGKFCFSIAEPLGNAFRDLKKVCLLEGPLLKPYRCFLFRPSYFGLEFNFFFKGLYLRA